MSTPAPTSLPGNRDPGRTPATSDRVAVATTALRARRPDTRSGTRPSRSDLGLALLDVLLGMAIFALIVVIAIQSIGQYRQRAFEITAMADATQVGGGLLAGSTTANGGLPALGSVTTDGAYAFGQLPSTFGADSGTNSTRNTSVAGVLVAVADPSRWHVCVVHRSGGTVDAWAVFSNRGGAVTISGRGSTVTGDGTNPEGFDRAAAYAAYCTGDVP